MKPVVIIGSGLAAWSLVREFRRLDRDRPVIVACADAGDFYAKPNLSNALTNGKVPQQLINTPAATLAAQQNVTLYARHQLVQIDREQQVVQLQADETGTVIRLDYGQLVLAVGADPIRLPLQGDAAAAVCSVNHLDDYRHFRTCLDALPQGSRVVVIGAGLIGCEFANDLANAGYAVSVFDPAPQVLGRLLPVQTAAFVRQQLAEKAGIDWHLGDSIVQVDAAPDATGSYHLTSQQGATLSAALVLSAVGLRPRTSLAVAAGLPCGRGISVNRLLQTADANIYALGDCAEVDGLNLPFVQPIMLGAKALAATLAGNPTPVVYPAMPVVVKTPACPVVVAPPAAGVSGAWEETSEADGMTARYVDNAGQLLGFALAGTASVRKQALAKLLPPTLG